jgi:hypothetical protein
MFSDSTHINFRIATDFLPARNDTKKTVKTDPQPMRATANTLVAPATE